MKLSTKIIIGFLFYFAAAFIYTGIVNMKKDLALALISLVIGIALGVYAFLFMRRKQAEAKEQELNQEMSPQSHASLQSAPSRKHIKLVAPDEGEEEKDDLEEDDDETTFPIKGINYANLDDSYLGDHDGVIKAVTDNPKDPYAIAVFVGRKRVGWLPRGNSNLHAELLNIGGKAKVSIVISKSYDDFDDRPFYYGKATIQK